jgi:hypothetical protein
MVSYAWKSLNVVVTLSLVTAAATAEAGVLYQPPAGGWTYTYEGDAASGDADAALDGTWEHNNGSDEWDGTPPGTGSPGGAVALTDGNVTYLRIQDTGDPRGFGFPDPGSNRKVFLDRDIIGLDGISETYLDDGFTISFRMRLSTGAGLDELHVGGVNEPWPAEGLGYVIAFDSTTMVSLYQPGGTGSMGFTLTVPNNFNAASPDDAGLMMNDLNGDVPCTNCGDSGMGDLNLLPLDNLTQWHEFWITIQQTQTGAGTHDVTVYVDGSTQPNVFEVTAGVRADGGDLLTQGPLSIGLPGTVYQGAFDLDFLSYREGVHVPSAGGLPQLQAGDADRDLDFDQLDLVKVQIVAKYLTGQAATWGEGDWNGAPGGSATSPPAGNGRFDQLDIIAALNADKYLKGPYAAVAAGGSRGDAQTSVIYNPATGELAVDAPAGTQLTSINIDSAGAVFTGAPAANLGGSFDNDKDNNIFKATFGSSFGSLSFGNVAQAGLSQQFVLNDLTVVGSLAGGGGLGNVDLIYVPEPATVVLMVLGLWGLVAFARRRPHI